MTEKQSGSQPGFHRVGIVGGGQLGMMLCEAAHRISLTATVLTDDPTSSAVYVADQSIVAPLDDLSAVARLIEASDVVTFELEAIPDETLGFLEQAELRGEIKVHPSVSTLRLIKDKGLQKTWLKEQGLPTLPFMLVDENVEQSQLEKSGFNAPLVQKTRRGGYDGKGVQILLKPDSLSGLWPVASVIEPALEGCTEAAVVVARAQSGETSAYPPVTMLFDPGLNAVSTVISPGALSEARRKECLDVALRAVEALSAVGVFAVELFISTTGEIFINEISPRVHNSGHLTMEGFACDQFEQHLRAISGRPVASIEAQAPVAVMLNLLYEDRLASAHTGAPYTTRLQAPGEVTVHWYGKKEARAGRKMGHVNALGETVAEALGHAQSGLRKLQSDTFQPPKGFSKVGKS
ncbi:MAG: 5-(carboxyamino)imidazole ribonucleotide synthase [Arenicellales bacterium]|jgi:5-(carboxyamino)imidazole ribonucleotide synthase|nr:ATP-grasp domain-containing protein [Gammaproteobacteria bacterium]NDA14328.1 ATP-grasp domain-containing protein [Gammaproteobacteria bacterium]NDG43600.1 ATP-grasp domain-containing protein [Gammaproteobacteria bacterium]